VVFVVEKFVVVNEELLILELAQPNRPAACQSM